MKQPFEFFTQSSRDPDNRWANTARLVNCYREASGDGRVTVKSVLGTEAFAVTGSIFTRAMEFYRDRLYMVAGERLFEVNANGDVSNLGAVADSPDTTISSNNGDITVAAGGNYYVWNGTALSQPATGAFSDFGSVTFYGQLTVLTERDGRRVQWSGVADATTLGGLDFATTESRDDSNLRAQPINGELWIFKERSIERWYQDGAGLASIPGGTLDIGLKSFRLLTPMGGGGAFFIGDDNRAYIAPDMAPVSTVPVETSISQEAPSECFYYEDEGHKFCVLNFTDRPAWVLDVTTGEWHERAEGNALGAWNVQASVQGFGSRYYLGSYTGQVLRLLRSNADWNGHLVRRAVGRTFQASGEKFGVAEMQIQGRFGQSMNSPEITLRTSGNFGFSFGQARVRVLGEIGQQDSRIVFRNLGRFRQFTPELTWTDEYDFNLDAAAFVRFS